MRGGTFPSTASKQAGLMLIQVLGESMTGMQDPL